MRTIWKFPIKVEDSFEIEMPRAAELMQVQVQNGDPVLWAIVVPERLRERRRFRVFGTGHVLGATSADDLSYVGSFQLGIFVGHLFEERRQTL